MVWLVYSAVQLGHLLVALPVGCCVCMLGLQLARRSALVVLGASVQSRCYPYSMLVI